MVGRVPRPFKALSSKRQAAPCRSSGLSSSSYSILGAPGCWSYLILTSSPAFEKCVACTLLTFCNGDYMLAHKPWTTLKPYPKNTMGWLLFLLGFRPLLWVGCSFFLECSYHIYSCLCTHGAIRSPECVKPVTPCSSCSIMVVIVEIELSQAGTMLRAQMCLMGGFPVWPEMAVIIGHLYFA